MQLLSNILVLASVYALIASGYVLVYKVSRVLNLAHGEIMVIGAYLLLATSSAISDNLFVAVAFAAMFSGFLGVAIYLALMKRMTGRSILTAILVTVAAGVIIRGLIAMIWSPQSMNLAHLVGFPTGSISVAGSAQISSISATLVGVTVLTYAAILGFLYLSSWGIRMRAAGQNPLLAAQRGIQLSVVYALAWGLAALTGSVAGILLAAETRLEIGLAAVALKAFPAALVGGLDSVPGAAIGAIVIAVCETLVIYFGSPLLSNVVPFLLLLLMLIVRPWGLFGTREELDRV